jgi:hypothetical protein
MKSASNGEALSIATISIIFYLSLALLSFYYYRKFLHIEKANKGVSLSVYYRNNIGRYDDTKKLFFFILTVSSLLEIPTYLGCLVLGGPEECEWNNVTFMLFWFFHMLALCGYAFCIVIPCVLWSDMVNKRDGKLFFSVFPYDNVKRFFRVLILSYLINTIGNLVAAIVYYQPSNPKHFKETYSYSFCAVVECVEIFLISLGCMYCGIKLQVYVHKAKLNPLLEMKFLFSLNVVLFVVVLSFLGRAILVLEFAHFMADFNWKEGCVTYSVFVIISRWLPDVFCQFCLILLMRTPSSEIAKKTLNNSSSRSRGTTAENEDALLDPSERQSQPSLRPSQQSQRSTYTNNSSTPFDIFSIFYSPRKERRSISRREGGGSIKNPIANSENGNTNRDEDDDDEDDQEMDTNISEKDSSYALSALESQDDHSYKSTSTVSRNDVYGDHVTILTHLTSKRTIDLNDPTVQAHNRLSSEAGSQRPPTSTSVDSYRVVIGEQLQQYGGSPQFPTITPPRTPPRTPPKNSVDIGSL